MRARRGADRGSMAIHKLSVDQPVSAIFFNQERLATAITRLWRRAVDQRYIGLMSQAVGISISVGIRIFSIVRG